MRQYSNVNLLHNLRISYSHFESVPLFKLAVLVDLTVFCLVSTQWTKECFSLCVFCFLRLLFCFITIFLYTNWSTKQFRRRMGVDHEFRWIWLIKYSFSLVFFEIYHVTFLSKKIIVNDKFHSPAELNNAKLWENFGFEKTTPTPPC